jgi:pimeloyl-ACP methyl ester carboxylesterase
MRTSFLVIGLLSLIIAACQSVQPATPTATLAPTTAPTPTIISTAALSPTSTTVSLPPGTEIIFDETGNKQLAGTTYGEGQTAILLANMSIGGQKQWDPFVAAVDKEKFTTVTFDYRNINDVNQDMDLVLNRLREAGFERVICIGASLGTRACSSIALEPEIVGLVLIAGSVHHASVAEATYPKLFISGALDRWAFDIQKGHEQAAEPKTLMLFENNRAHGTDLFRSEDTEQFLTLLTDFVNGLATP